MRLKAALCGVLAVCMCLAAGASEWYVEAGAGGGGDGTSGNPFNDLNDVKAVIQAGDTVWVRSGTYNEIFDLWNKTPGASVRTYFRAVPGHTPIIDGSGLGGSNYLVQFGQSDKVTIDGFTIRDVGPTLGVAMNLYYSDDCEILNCTFINTSGRGASVYFSDRAYLYNCDFEGGVAVRHSDGTVVEDNLIHDSSSEGITVHNGCINCEVIGNTVYDNQSVNIYIDNSSYALVDSNLVHITGNPSDHGDIVGIMLADEKYTETPGTRINYITVTNNILFNNSYGFRFWKGEYASGSGLKNCVIANNTIVKSKSTAISWDAGAHTGTIIRNNICDNPSTSTRLLVGKSTSGISIDHNLWYMPGASLPFSWGATSYNHADWVAASGQGSGDVLGDPLFEGARSLPADNFKLSGSSPAIDEGVTGGTIPTVDYNGSTRDSWPDIGAYEYELDTDADGMPDWWEDQHGLNKTNPGDAGLDPDGDGLTNLQEYQNRTDPNDDDSDDDQMNDGDEVDFGFDPNDADQDDNGTVDGLDDWDNDGILNKDDPTPGSPPSGNGGAGDGGGCGTGAGSLFFGLLIAAAFRKRKTRE